MTKLAEDQLGIKILGPVYFGVRQVGLKTEKKINTPADLAGVKLRMPGGDAWQFLGQALGANPTPMAYAEVYTGLQTGAIDGQDNPLPNVENMKFYEVMSQIALTSHLVGFDVLTISKTAWDAMSAGATGPVPGSSRRGHRLEHRGASKAGGGAGRHLQGEGARHLHARRRCFPGPRPEKCTSSPISPRLGRQAWSSASTPSEKRFRRAPPDSLRWRSDPLRVMMRRR